MIDKRNNIIPCELSRDGLKELQQELSMPLFETLDGKKEDYEFVYNQSKNMVDVLYKGEEIATISNAFWAKIVEVKPPQHWED